ncbi:MAG: hypothetical protein PWP08_1295 [Methanofollis sp.]|nr:hypothetical protein [Methanofollis sp.]
MEKIRIETNVFLPMPVVLVGTVAGGRPNIMTAGWASRVNAEPPMIAIGINRAHATAEGIVENGSFSVNVPHAGMVEATDYCGLVSGKNTDKSAVFDLFSGDLDGAPMIRACPLAMECRLVRAVDLPTDYLFIGEIVGAYADADCLVDGKPDMERVNPLTLTMPDNTYRTIGVSVGKAWEIGTHLKKGA